MRALVAVFVLALSVGCQKENPEANKTAPAGSASAPLTPAAANASVSAGGAAAEAAKPHKRRMVGSVSQMLVRAASELELDAAKKTKVEEIDKSLHAEGPRDEMKALHEEIIAEVKAGKIDQAKIDAKQADLEKAMKAHHDKTAESLNQLHATLDEGQRKAVVARVREALKQREAHMAKWMEKEKEKEGEGKDKKKEGFAGHLAKELDLTDAQQKKVEAIMPKDDKGGMMADMEAMKKKEQALLDAFEKSDFDAKKLEEAEGGKKFHGPMDGKFLAQLLPILDAKQRDKLAENMSKMGQGHHGMGMGKHPMPGAPSAAPSGSASAAPDDDGDDD